MTAPRSYQMHEHTMHASPPPGSPPPPHRKQNLQLPVSLLGAPTRSVVHAGSCSVHGMCLCQDQPSQCPYIAHSARRSDFTVFRFDLTHFGPLHKTQNSTAK
ncbi:hypothetical protein JZ751_020400 [Albula glossodonta]|uniref:Uncharacterized protein n=1 Tax=Albula glossodonta TaxID=121402 RepID=A0A8T2MV31_9TELE|nr:hypothetical protein JZ751_020400 [Albula glossodonta]